MHGITTTMSEPHEITNVMGRAGIDFYLEARAGSAARPAHHDPHDGARRRPSSTPTGRLDARPTSADLLTAGRRHRPGRGHGLHGPHLRRGLGRLLRPVRAPGGRRPRPGRHRAASWRPTWSPAPSPTTRPPTRSCCSSAGGWACGPSSARARPPATWPGPCPFSSSTAPSAPRSAPTTATPPPSPSTTTSTEWWPLSCRAGVSVSDALRAATINPATLYRLYDRGSVTPGYRADLLIVDDPSFPHPREVIQHGTRRRPRRRAHGASAGDPRAGLAPVPAGPCPTPTTSLPPAPDGLHRARAIHIAPRTIVSDERFVEVQAAGRTHLRPIPTRTSASWRSSSAAGRRRLAATAGTAIGLRPGQRPGPAAAGAIATTIAHDAHHLLVIGVDTGGHACRGARSGRGGRRAGRGRRGTWCRCCRSPWPG